MANSSYKETLLPYHLHSKLRIDSKLGSGIYGDVFKCYLRDEEQDQTLVDSKIKKSTGFAIKKIRSSILADSKPTQKNLQNKKKNSFDWKHLYGISQLTLREIVILKSLDHPNVIQLLDFHIEIITNPNTPIQDYHNAQRDLSGVLNRETSEIEQNFSRLVSLQTRSPSPENIPNNERFKEVNYEKVNYLDGQKNDKITEEEFSSDVWLIFELAENDLEKLIRSRYLAYFRWEAQVLKNYGEDAMLSMNPNSPIFSNRPLPGLQEHETKGIIYQLLQGLTYIHSKRIIHRDLKPANIFIKKEDEISPFGVIKLGDFGLSCLLNPFNNRPKTEEVVTLLYRAPELLLGDSNYTSAIDIWSTAAIMGECILGRPIFGGKGEFDVIMRIFSMLGTPKLPELTSLKHLLPCLPHFKCDTKEMLRLRFTERYSKRLLLSETGIDLIDKLLNYHPTERLTAADALKHPWFEDIADIIGTNLISLHLKPKLSLPKHYLSPNPNADPTDIQLQMDVSSPYA